MNLNLIFTMSALTISAYLILGFAASFHPNWKKENRAKLLIRSFFNSLPPVGAGILAVVTMSPPLVTYTDRLRTPLGIVVLGLVAGVFLWALKNRNKDLYGKIEVAFSVLSLSYVGINFSTIGTMQAALGFFGAVYIFVRGASNIQEAKNST